MLDMQLLWSLNQALEMETKLGMPAIAKFYRHKISQLKSNIQKQYWSEQKQLYADTRDQNTYSQHTNAFAILSGVAGKRTAALGIKLLSDTSITQCSIYFKYYLHQALIKAGLGNSYLAWLGDWRNNIDWGLTTWAETSDLKQTRSDCHAWGASPNIEFYRTVLGINTASAGFKKVKIEPHLGTLLNISGEIPHPQGKVKVDYHKLGTLWKIEVELPRTISGTFIWNGRIYPLRAGNNRIRIR